MLLKWCLKNAFSIRDGNGPAWAGPGSGLKIQARGTYGPNEPKNFDFNSPLCKGKFKFLLIIYRFYLKKFNLPNFTSKAIKIFNNIFKIYSFFKTVIFQYYVKFCSKTSASKFTCTHQKILSYFCKIRTYSKNTSMFYSAKMTVQNSCKCVFDNKSVLILHLNCLISSP